MQTNSPPSFRSTLIGAACLSAPPLILNAISVPAMAYLIHRLGATNYGKWMVATSLVSVCAILTNLGLRGAFVRSIATDRSAIGVKLAEQLGLRAALTIMAAAAAVGLCHLIGYSTTILRCTAIGGAGLILITFTATLADLLQATHHFKIVAMVNFVAGLSLTIASVAIAYVTANPVAFAAAYLVGPLVASLLMARFVSRRVCPVAFRWNPRQFIRLLGQSRFFAFQQFLAVASAQMESLVLPRLIGMKAFGFFSAGTLLPNRLTAIPDSLCTVAYPAMSRACASGNPSLGRSAMLKYLAIAGLAGAAISLATMPAAGLIGSILFPRYPHSVVMVIRITIWALPLMAVESVMGYALNAAGRDASQSRASIPASIVSLAVSIVLITTLGLPGACFSMALRPVVRALFLAPLFVRTFQGNPGAVPTLDQPTMLAAQAVAA